MSKKKKTLKLSKEEPITLLKEQPIDLSKEDSITLLTKQLIDLSKEEPIAPSKKEQLLSILKEFLKLLLGSLFIYAIYAIYQLIVFNTVDLSVCIPIFIIDVGILVSRVLRVFISNADVGMTVHILIAYALALLLGRLGFHVTAMFVGVIAIGISVICIPFLIIDVWDALTSLI